MKRHRHSQQTHS